MDSHTPSAQVARLEVVDSGRRRRWSDDEKLKIVLESLAVPRQVSATARQYGIARSQLLQWRRLFRPERTQTAEPPTGFVPAVVVPDREAASSTPAGSAVAGAIEIEFASGARMRITGTVDPAAEGGRRGADRRTRAMIPLPVGVRVWLATGHTDMRKGFASLALQVQQILQRDPLSGHLFCFRGRRGDLLKVIWHDGQGACLFSKRLERGRFLWPSPADGVVAISPAQLGYLLSGIDWRHPQETWRPTSVG